VAAASFTSPDVDEVLAAQARHARVAGIRQTIRWHPDPALRWTEDKVVENPAWRRGVALLERHGFLLE
jgi:predicted TIM-barrel fold metal-dependent hydrolase